MQANSERSFVELSAAVADGWIVISPVWDWEEVTLSGKLIRTRWLQAEQQLLDEEAHPCGKPVAVVVPLLSIDAQGT